MNIPACEIYGYLPEKQETFQVYRQDHKPWLKVPLAWLLWLIHERAVRAVVRRQRLHGIFLTVEPYRANQIVQWACYLPDWFRQQPYPERNTPICDCKGPDEWCGVCFRSKLGAALPQFSSKNSSLTPARGDFNHKLKRNWTECWGCGEGQETRPLPTHNTHWPLPRHDTAAKPELTVVEARFYRKRDPMGGWTEDNAVPVY